MWIFVVIFLRAPLLHSSIKIPHDNIWIISFSAVTYIFLISPIAYHTIIYTLFIHTIIIHQKVTWYINTQFWWQITEAGFLSVLICGPLSISQHKHDPLILMSRGKSEKIIDLFLVLFFTVCDDIDQVLIVQVPCYIWRESRKHLLHLRTQNENKWLYSQCYIVTVSYRPSSNLFSREPVSLGRQHLCDTVKRRMMRWAEWASTFLSNSVLYSQLFL